MFLNSLKRILPFKKPYKPPEKVLKNFNVVLHFVGVGSVYTFIFYLSVLLTLLAIYCFTFYINPFQLYSMFVISITLEIYASLKIIFLWQKRFRLLELMERFQNDWKEYVLLNKSPELKVIEANKHTEVILFFYSINMGFWIFATLFYSVYTSVYYGDKQLNIVQITFGTDFGVSYQGSIYWILTILILIAIIVVAFILYLCDCIFISFCLVIIAQMKTLSGNLQEIGVVKPKQEALTIEEVGKQNDLRSDQKDIEEYARGISEEQVAQQLSVCVKRHYGILQHIRILDEIFSNPAFLQYIFTTIVLCLLMFHFNYSFNTDVRIIPFSMFSLLTAINLFIFTLFGQKIINQSSDIMNSAYSVPWYNYSPRFGKSVLLVMMRSKKPAHISGSRFYIISMESFAKVISAAASYYTFLKNVSADDS